jgi:hypothetical protein
MKREVDISALHCALRYDPETGLFFWKERPVSDFAEAKYCVSWNKKHAGKQAFVTKNAAGYLHSRVNRIRLSAHRVAIAMVIGEWPNVVDHINGNVSDNRLSNLREVTHAGNGQNCKRRTDNTTGVTGVSKARKYFRAEICKNGVRIRLGQFQSVDDAIAARKIAEKEYGFHENHGR